jgi:hypothetical protein
MNVFPLNWLYIHVQHSINLISDVTIKYQGFASFSAEFDNRSNASVCC